MSKIIGMVIGAVAVIVIMLVFFNSNTSLSGNVATDRCDIACRNSVQCDDFDDSTMDACRYPSQCNATCTHHEIQFVPSLN